MLVHVLLVICSIVKALLARLTIPTKLTGVASQMSLETALEVIVLSAFRTSVLLQNQRHTILHCL